MVLLRFCSAIYTKIRIRQQKQEASHFEGSSPLHYLTYNDNEGGGRCHVLELDHGHEQRHVVVLGPNEK